MLLTILCRVFNLWMMNFFNLLRCFWVMIICLLYLFSYSILPAWKLLFLWVCSSELIGITMLHYPQHASALVDGSIFLHYFTSTSSFWSHVESLVKRNVLRNMQNKWVKHQQTKTLHDSFLLQTYIFVDHFKISTWAYTHKYRPLQSRRFCSILPMRCMLTQISR